MIQKGIRFFCVICLAFSAAFLATDAIRISVADAGLSGTPQSATQAPYWLGVYQGKVAAFQAGQEEPIEVFDLYLSSLPEINQQELLRGLPAQNKRELQAFIEDYTS